MEDPGYVLFLLLRFISSSIILLPCVMFALMNFFHFLFSRCFAFIVLIYFSQYKFGQWNLIFFLLFIMTLFRKFFQVQEEARVVGQLRHERLVNLIRCYCDGDEHFLVAKYMPNGTLAKHLFHCMYLLNLIRFVWYTIYAIERKKKCNACRILAISRCWWRCLRFMVVN